MKKPAYILSIALTMFSIAVHAQPVAEFASVVNKQLSENEFSGIVVVAKNGAVVFEKTSGYADEETKVPISADTRFSLGSIGKFFTGVLIMKLVEEGKINVDDPISKYPPEWKIPNGDKIKISHLLTHSSGLGGYMGTPEHNKLRGNRADIDQLMKLVVAAPLIFDEPGLRHQYSNSGFIVLGKLIEKLEGLDYFTVLQKRILTPLKMNNSTFTIDLTDTKKFAKGYFKDQDGTVKANTEIIPPSADGGLFSTWGDILKFDQALYGDKIISKTTLAEMEKPRMGSYGYATMITKTENGIGYGHNGGMPGYEADYRHFFIGDDQYTVIVLANRDRKAVRMMMELVTVLSGIHE